MKALVAALSMLFSLWFRLGLAQPSTALLTGRVLDAKTNQPLPFATVYLNNSAQGTNADQNGVYRLTTVPLGNQELVGSFLGYQTTRLPLRLTDTHARTLDLRLEPTEQALASVTVRAHHDKAWMRQLTTFTREVLGNRPQARQCRLLNPNVLSFREEKGHLSAQANEPLVIDNQALGYQLHYNLLYFDLYQGKMQFAGTSRFEELPARDARQKTRWQNNRLAVYQGSIQHLLASLVAGTHEQAGYQIYQTPLTDEGQNRALPFVRTQERQYIDAQKVATLIKPGGLSFERQLSSDQPLEVYYDRIYAANSPYRDSPYAYSMLLLPNHTLDVNTNGWVTRSNGLDVRGYMGNDRLATLLPADWSPPVSEMLLTSSITSGRVSRADAGLDSLSRQRKREEKRTAPVVYLQTDKSFYVTGDALWLSVYVVDAARQLPVTGRTPLLIELLTPTGQVAQYQWVAITDGRGGAGFRLADSLATGPYRLRAMTSLDASATNPAFECTFPLYSSASEPGRSGGLSALAPKANASSPGQAADSLDVQFLPEGGRWLAGQASRLGVKVVAPDGRGRAINGRIVDQINQEIARFTTNALGMGQLTLTPQLAQPYRALLEPSGQVINLPPVEGEGWSLSADAVSDSSRLLVSVHATGRYRQQPVYVTLQSREQLVYQQKWLLEQGQARFALTTASLPPGVCRLTVWDTSRQARAERLVYIPDRGGSVQMRVSLAQAHYEARQTVSVGFQLRDPEGYPVGASWSAAVTDADQVPLDTSRADLRTYLLLTGGLRGWVEAPSYYLEPEHLTDLDNLLLTQGWRRLPAVQAVDSTGGWTLGGHVHDRQGRPVANQSMLLLLAQNGQQQLFSPTTDEQGGFRLAGLQLSDTVTVRARVLGKGENAARILFDWPGGALVSNFVGAAPWQPLASQVRDARGRQLAWPAFYRDSSARQLAEVVVKAYKPRAERTAEQERSSLHTAPDHVMVVEPGVVYADMNDLLNRFPALKLLFRRNMTSFGDTSPLYLLDGVYASWELIKDLNPSTVSRVEIMMNATNAGIYGARGGNGVIAIYTRTDGGQTQSIPKTVLASLVGFSSTREFYVPRYGQPPGPGSPVDRRDVLYWQALGQTDADGFGRLVFPLNDTAKRLRVVLQGLTNEGVPMAFTWELPVR